jgi:hypothetical protein
MINYFEYPGMFHAWPIFPISEAQRTIEQIELILKGVIHKPLDQTVRKEVCGHVAGQFGESKVIGTGEKYLR